MNLLKTIYKGNVLTNISVMVPKYKGLSINMIFRNEFQSREIIVFEDCVFKPMYEHSNPTIIDITFVENGVTYSMKCNQYNIDTLSFKDGKIVISGIIKDYISNVLFERVIELEDLKRIEIFNTYKGSNEELRNIRNEYITKNITNDN